MLRAVTLLKSRHSSLRLLNRHPRFQSSDAAHETDTAHQSIFGYVRLIKRRGDKNLGVTAEPRDWEIWQNADDRGGDAIERDAPPEHTRICAETFAPEIFRYQGNVVLHFLLLKKIAAANRMDASQVEIVSSDIFAEDLDR